MQIADVIIAHHTGIISQLSLYIIPGLVTFTKTQFFIKHQLSNVQFVLVFLLYSNFIVLKLPPKLGPGITALFCFIMYFSLYHLVTLLVVIRLVFYHLLYIYGHSAFMSLLLSPSQLCRLLSLQNRLYIASYFNTHPKHTIHTDIHTQPVQVRSGKDVDFMKLLTSEVSGSRNLAVIKYVYAFPTTTTTTKTTTYIHTYIRTFLRVHFNIILISLDLFTCLLSSSVTVLCTQAFQAYIQSILIRLCRQFRLQSPVVLFQNLASRSSPSTTILQKNPCLVSSPCFISKYLILKYRLRNR